MDERGHPVVIAISLAFAAASAVFAIWCTVIAFIGGTLPLFGTHITASIGFGVVWVFILDPVIASMAYSLSLLFLLPIAALRHGDVPIDLPIMPTASRVERDAAGMRQR